MNRVDWEDNKVNPFSVELELSDIVLSSSVKPNSYLVFIYLGHWSHLYSPKAWRGKDLTVTEIIES